jgi:hypothetical protein
MLGLVLLPGRMKYKTVTPSSTSPERVLDRVHSSKRVCVVTAHIDPRIVTGFKLHVVSFLPKSYGKGRS